MNKYLDRAFPVGISDRKNGFIGEGMTLRDYFAAKALPAIYTEFKEIDPYSSVIAIAEYAYRLADAMLTAREQE